MLYDTEGRMFHLIPFSFETHTSTHETRKRSESNGKENCENATKRESEKTEKQLRAQQFDSRSPSNNRMFRRELVASPDVEHMQHAMCC